MNKPLLSFHGKQEIKDKKVADLIRHKELDNMIQRDYYNREKKKGCAVTCTMFSPEEFAEGNIDTSDIHGRYVTELGIPRIIARMEDRIFEGLSVENSKNWPLDFMQAIPVGVNLEPVWRKFMIWLLIDDTAGVVKFAKNKKTEQAIRDVAEAFETSLTQTVPIEKWQELRKAADAAAAAAADAAAAAAADAAAAAAYAADAAAAAAAAYAAAAAAYAADAAAAAAAAYAAAAAAAYAAYAADAAAAAAAARNAAREGHFSMMAAKLIELLKEAA